MNNVKLWFAKDGNDNIITINEINQNDKDNTYRCPMCASKLIPKALESKRITAHFAHVDVSKCGESMIHWWFKNKFLEKGDNFKVKSDREKEYVCKDVLIEKECATGGVEYRPDVTILTECGETIYFEMAFSNKKSVKDYLDIWLELKNIVVEVDIKDLMNNSESPTFNALFYNGKCFNTKRNDTYYNTIGKYKEEKLNGKIDGELKERIRKLDWFWDDLLRYKNGEVDIDHMTVLIDSVSKEESRVLEKVLSKPFCNNIKSDYLNHKLNKKYQHITKYVKDVYGENYTRYITKHVEHIKQPFVGSWYESKIKVEDLKNERFIVYDFSYTDRVDDVINCINEIIPANIEIEAYNINAETLQQAIHYSHIKNNIVNSLKKRKEDYNHEIKVSRYRKNLTDSFMVSFEFKYKQLKIPKCSFKKKVDINENIDEYIIKFENLIKNYFETLKPLENTYEIEVVSKEIARKYIDFNITVAGDLFLEDVYRINVLSRGKMLLKSYYITNDNIFLDENKENRLFSIKNKKQIKNYLVNDIDNTIRNRTRKTCLECSEDFILKMGEIKFFNKKNFDYPKRCKSCRNNRKNK